MDLTALSAYSTLAAAIGQIASAVAIVVSLVYLARQLRHNARSVEVQTFASVMANNVSFTSAIYVHPELAELVVKGANNLSSLSPVEAVRWQVFMRTLFRQFDNFYHASQAGALEIDIWPGYERIMMYWLRYPSCFRWFEDNASFFSASLQKLYAAKIRPQLVPEVQERQPGPS